MISFEEAYHIVKKSVVSPKTERVNLDESYRRVLAEPIIADRDQPPYHRSAMDGYAFRSDDFEVDFSTPITVVETIYAGHTPTKVLGSKQAYKIMTGASVPDDADVVVQKEKIDRIDDYTIRLQEKPIKGKNIAQKGEDIKRDTTLLNRHEWIDSNLIALLATFGYSKVNVVTHPKVCVISTGDELVAVNENPKDNQIRGSNLYLLKSLLKDWGISQVDHHHFKDEEQKIRSAIQNALHKYDLLITTGAVSAGDTDFIPDILASCGVQKLFHKTAIKPGKPIWFGHDKSQDCTVFGLPGNPLSCKVGFMVFISAWLNLWFGINPKVNLYTLEKPVKKNNQLDLFLPAYLVYTQNHIHAVPIAYNGSGDMSSIFKMTGFIRIPKGEGFTKKDDGFEWYDAYF